MNLLAIAPIDHDLARTLARMLERRLAGRAGDAAAYADLAPPVGKGAEAWFELILRGDDASRVRLAAALSRLAPSDTEVSLVRRELDGTRPRLQKLAWATAVAGFAVAAGMLVFGGAPIQDASAPASQTTASAVTVPVEEAPPAPSTVAAPAAVAGVYGPAAPPAATQTPPAPANVYGPAAPAFTAPAVAPAALPMWSAPVAPTPAVALPAVVPAPAVAAAPAVATPAVAPASALAPAASPPAPAPVAGATPPAVAP